MSETPVSYSAVYHVGNLDGDRDAPSYSHEGAGVSVSRCPQDWARITDLGPTTYGLVNLDGLFYNSALGDTRDFVYEWCLENNFISEVEGCRLYHEGTTTGEEAYIETYDREEALNKHHNYPEDYPNSRVVTVTSVALAEKGRAYWGRAFTRDADSASPTEILGLLPVWYAENTTDADYDGVWWHNRHDPRNYSAPRGVIFQSKLDAWDVAWESNFGDPKRPQLDELVYQYKTDEE